MTSFLLCGLVFVEWASSLRTGHHMLHSEANTRHWQMFRFLFPGFPELCFHICSCWYFSWNTNWQNHENKLRRAVKYILLCHGLHIWSWHDQSIKMLDGKRNGVKVNQMKRAGRSLSIRLKVDAASPWLDPWRASRCTVCDPRLDRSVQSFQLRPWQRSIVWTMVEQVMPHLLRVKRAKRSWYII